MRKILALVCLALLTPGHAAGQNAGQNAAGRPAQTNTQAGASDEMAEAARLNAEVLRLYREGKYDEALPLAKRVLEIRERALGADDALVAYALHNLASIYAAKGKDGDAETLFNRALAIMEKRGGAESDLAADIRSQLGVLRLFARDYKEAGPLLQRALSIKERLHGADDPSLVPALLNLTDLYILRGEAEQAHAFLGRAVSILEREPPRHDPLMAKRLKGYYCPLMGLSGASDKELAGKVGHAAWRFEEPEKAAEYEKQQRERAARGEADDTVAQGGVLNGHAIKKPAPEYPPAAKQQRVMGIVVVKIIVDETGKVVEAEVVCGHPILAKAAIAAARGARFTPTTLSGMPVKVSGIITYNFVLQ